MKKLALILAISMLFISIAGCGGGGTTDTTTAGGTATTAAASGGTTAPSGGASPADKPNTVTIATQQDFVILDPFYTSATPDYQANWCMFDSLLNQDAQGNTYPLVAESWEFSDDGLEFVVHIREGITFHDGTPVTAEDVVYSAMLMKEAPYKARVAILFTDAEVIDTYTMKFNLPQPAASFIYELAYNFAVYPKAYHSADPEGFKNNPIGCGAYQFVSRKSGEGVVLKAYDNYYGGKADIENIVFKVIPDASTALVSLENGEIDLCQYVPAASYPLVLNNSKLELLQTPYTRVFNIILNMEEEPWAGNKVLRQALAHAIDKQFLVDVALEGYGSVAYALVNESFIAYPKNLKQHERVYDVEKAKELLIEAGYPGGAGLKLKLTTIEMFKKQSELIQAMLQEVGIDMQIEMVELSTYISDAAAGVMNMGLMSTNQGSDASVFSGMLITESTNGANYGNPEVDALFTKASAILDNDERSKVFDELYAIVLDEMPYISIYFVDTISCGRVDLNFADIMNYVGYKGMYYSYK